MSEYVISCSSTADLTKEHMEARDINYACFHYSLNGEEYMDDLGQSMSFEEFYKRLVDGEEPKTSQINADEYIDYFEGFLSQGLDILHVTLSSGISGTYNSACIAKDELKYKYPNRKVYIIDSLAASSGYGLLMDKVADLRDSGIDIDTLARWIEANKLRLNHWFFSSDLTFFIKGGRVSKTAGLVGEVLSICPFLNVSNTGTLEVREKIRTKKKAIKEMVNRMGKLADDDYDYTGKCYISNSACYEDARAVADEIEERFPNLEGKVMINSVGTTIGSHTGPGTVALFFWGEERTN